MFQKKLDFSYKKNEEIDIIIDRDIKLEELSNQFVVLVIIFMICPLFLFGMSTLPRHWLGGMDGYFYGNMIKVYLNSYDLLALDMQSPVNYPPYYFYFLGILGRLSGIHDLGVLQLSGAIVANIILPLAVYYMLRPIFGGIVANFTIICMFILSVSSYGSIHIWQKPHEILAFTGLFSVMNYIHNLFSKEQTELSNRLLAGIITALAIGSYTPFMVAPIISIVIISIFFVKIWQGPSLSIKLLRIFDPAFTLPLLLLSAPYAIALIENLLTKPNGIGVVTWFNENDLHYEFLSSGAQSIPYYVAVLLVMAVLCIKKFRRVSTIYPAILVALGFAEYSYLMLEFSLGKYSTAPFKYYLNLPIACSLLISSLLPRKTIDDFFSKSRFVTGFIIFSIIAMVTSNFVFSRIMDYPQISDSLKISQARWKNISNLVHDINLRKKNEKLDRYLGSYENSFLNYYVDGIFINHIIFNHSYASIYEDIPKRSKDLRVAIDSGSEEIYKYLKENNINILFLETPLSDDKNFLIQHTLNHDRNMGQLESIYIPVTEMDKLTAERKLRLDRRGRLSIYTVI